MHNLINKEIFKTVKFKFAIYDQIYKSCNN